MYQPPLPHRCILGESVEPTRMDASAVFFGQEQASSHIDNDYLAGWIGLDLSLLVLSIQTLLHVQHVLGWDYGGIVTLLQ